MIRTEIKKDIFNFWTPILVLFLYFMFLLGDCEAVLPSGERATVLGAIWNKYHDPGWRASMQSSYLLRMYFVWTDNLYLPILMPLICGLPSAISYIEEVETGNKKWILHRCSIRRFYLSKIVGNAVSAVFVLLTAVGLYYVTLYLFFDKMPISHEAFPILYSSITGIMPEDIGEMSFSPIIYNICKGVLYFCVYAVQCASFCLWMSFWLRERYTVFGVTILVSYLQTRIVEEMSAKYLSDGIEGAGIAADILNPMFLHFAGHGGFYENRELLALALSLAIICFNYFMAACLSRRRLDLSA